MEATIGRESGAAAPRLCIKIGNTSKFIGEPGSVPKSVSRNHCRLELQDDGRIRISNISDQNSLFVNGTEYKTKLIVKEDLVQLGSERYTLDVKAVLKVLSNDNSQPKSFKISYLKGVWDNYSQAKLDIQIHERKVNALSAIPGVISMISIALSFIDGLRAIFITIAAIFALAFALIRMKNADKVPLEQKELDERFQDEYVCPNCKHYLGYKSYKLVLKDGGCPWCKAKYTE